MQPAIILFERLFPGVHFHPANFLFAFVGFFDSGIEYPHRGAPDVSPRAIAFNKWNDWVVGNLELPVRSHGDFGTVFRDLYDFVLCHVLLTCKNSLRASVKLDTSP